MTNKIYRTIKKAILNDELSLNDIEEIIKSYTDYNLKKSQVRHLISIYSSRLLSDIGILKRNTSSENKQHFKERFNLKDIIISENNNSSIDQRLQIGDMVYKFDVKEKLSSLKS